MKPTKAILAACVLAWAISACADSSSEPRQSASLEVSPTAPSSSGAPAQCPITDGGPCRGDLVAGQWYTTTEFDPAFNYSAPVAGWTNYVDLYGNFVLVSPGSTIEGVDAGTSDNVSVHRAILPTLPAGAKCDPLAWPLGHAAGPSPQRVAKYFQSRHDLLVTTPKAVEVGGLKGVVIDIEARSGASVRDCRASQGTRAPTTDWLFSGIVGADGDYGVAPGSTERLYLLGDGNRVLCIEVGDIHSAPTSLASLSAVAEAITFNR